MSDISSRDQFLRRRREIREQLGGEQRVQRLHARGAQTIRERIDQLVDPGSFTEVGTFSRSARAEDRDSSPGDGKIGGLAKVNDRSICVLGDDVTVFHGSSSLVGGTRTHRLIDHAMQHGHPIVYFGETGGARLPDTLGSEGFSQVPPSMTTAARARRVPMACAIVGRSFGGSSFKSAMSDFVVQVEGSCLAVTSPRVIEIATGEQIDFESLGGVKVHDRHTGQLDHTAASEAEAIALIRQWLDYMPNHAWETPERRSWDGSLDPDLQILDLVPERRQRGYDMRRVVPTLTDDGNVLELKPNFGRSLITAYGRIAGRVVGFIASNPMFHAGAITPEACDKATSFVCQCDAFNIPLIFLQDTPGFMVGRQVEHSRILSRAIAFQQALALSRVPRLTVIMRKAFGLAYFSLAGGSHLGAESVVAWPGAEISFMDPQVGVNVVHAESIAAAADPESERARLIDEWTKDTDPFGAAGIMEIDEVIDPTETRAWLRTYIDRIHIDVPIRPELKPLAYWPTCF